MADFRVPGSTPRPAIVATKTANRSTETGRTGRGGRPVTRDAERGTSPEQELGKKNQND